MQRKYIAVGTVLTIMVVGIFGCTRQDANVPPTASFSLSSSTGNAPLNVSFDASSSSDSDGDIARYEWDFGDGSVGTGKTAAHRYDDLGKYDIKLTVTDDDGDTDSMAKRISVENSAPTAMFIMATDNIRGETALDASSSSDLDGEIVSYHWDFGDGTTGTGETTTHRYEELGKYDIKLTVTDNNGVAHSITKEMEVKNSPPAAEFLADIGDAEGKISFDASSSSDLDGEIVSYHWDFGDGTTGTGKTVVHTYSETGDYSVELTVTDSDGAASNRSQSVAIKLSQQIRVLDWRLRASNNMAISWVVVGHARNISGRKLDYVEVQAQFRDSNNVVLHSWFDNIADLQPGATWEFHVFMLGSTNADRVNRATISPGPCW